MRNTKTKEINELLEESKKYINNNLEDFIKVLPTLKNYSAKNKILIFKQNPKVGIVKSFNEWKKDNYKVKKGSKAIKIFIPTSKTLYEFENKNTKEKLKTYAKDKIDQSKFSLVSKENKNSFVLRGVLFDETQIENNENISKNVIKNRYKENKELIKQTVKYCEHKGIDIKLTNTLQNNTYGSAVFQNSAKSIKIKEGINEEDYLRVFFHEVAHIECEHDKKDISKEEKELQAETISYLVCRELGVDNKCNTLNYLNQYETDIEDIEGFIGIVTKISNDVLEDMQNNENTSKREVEYEEENE